MKPASGKDEMVNASAINDGAAVLAEGAPVQALGLKPMARLVGYAHAGVEPAYMGIGPGAGDAQGAAARRPEGRQHGRDRVEQDLRGAGLRGDPGAGPRPGQVTPNGLGISLGHPVCATGAIVTVKAIADLHRISGHHALVTMCIGGGQGIAAIFQRCV